MAADTLSGSFSSAFLILSYKSGNMRRNFLFSDRSAKPLHQILVKGQVVPRQQHGRDDFAGFYRVMQIGAAELTAGRAAASGVERFRVFGVPGILEIERAVPGKGLAVSTRSGRQHAVEHIHAPQDGANNVIRLADAHQVPRTV